MTIDLKQPLTNTKKKITIVYRFVHYLLHFLTRKALFFIKLEKHPQRENFYMNMPTNNNYT